MPPVLFGVREMNVFLGCVQQTSCGKCESGCRIMVRSVWWCLEKGEGNMKTDARLCVENNSLLVCPETKVK